MSDSNLTIKSVELESLIQKLDKDNQDILEVVKLINDDIKKLDETKWKSKEKEKLDSVLLPYLDLLDNNLHDYINKPLNILKNANKKHVETNEFLKNITEKL